MKIKYVILDENLRFDDVQAYAALLPPERQEKIARYRFEKDKLLSLAAGLLIRSVIGDKPITLGAHGKPFAQGVYFSVSHSGNIATIAVDETEIGLDVERVADDKRLKIADRFYHPNERDYVRDATDPCRAFSEIWTRKEAVLKMTGEGISTDLTAFDTTSSPLKDRLYTTAIDDYCFSLCSAEPIGERDADISLVELRELV